MDFVISSIAMQTLPDLKTLSNTEKDEVIILLWKQIELLQAQCARIVGLEKEIKELKNKLAKNNRNSSKPPSSDGYDKPQPKSQRKKSGRSSGEQPGHKGSTLRQVEHPDFTREHEGSHRAHCHADLPNQAVVGHETRQVFDFPEIKAAVTKRRAHIKTGPHCDNRVKAEFPVGMTRPVEYGNGVRATTTYLSQYPLLPCQRLQELFHDLFQIRLSEKTLNNILSREHQQLEQFEDATKPILRASKVVHFDESGIRLKKKLNWLHVASTRQLTCYHIDPKRGRVAMDAMAILPDFQGRAVHDHRASYYRYDCRHVLCNVRHLRELTFAQEQHQQQWAAELSQCLPDARREVDDARATNARSLNASRITYFDRRYSRLLRAGRNELPVLPVDKNKKCEKKKPHKVKNLHDRQVNHKKEVLAFLYDL